jgi:fermentation-respiration switch protein FrsA (DUF1100 family)
MYVWRLSDYPELRAEKIAFHNRTGILLDGWFFRGASRATIILSHGYGDDKNQMLPWADFLNRAGYNVFDYDMRSRGHSGGTAATLGALEQVDLTSAVDYLASRPDVDPSHIGALGVSLGGSVTILAAARDRRIRAVVDDCGFSDAPSIISATFEHFVGLPAFPFAPVTVKIAEIRTGVDINGVRPIDRIGLISPRAIFIIHGLADRTVPPADSAQNYAAARPPKAIWWVSGAHHVESLTVAHVEYVRRVVAFFRHYLGA